MSQGLFREVSLDKLRSPEQLDELIKVTSPRAWLTLVAIGCILVSAIVWGFLGSIPTKVEGQGILLNNGRVFSLRHHTAGQVIDVRFKLGDMVKRGDIVARIELPALVDKINILKSTLSELEKKQGVRTKVYKTIENQIKQLREELDFKSQILSPMDGRILEMNIEKVSILQACEPLVELDEYGRTVKLEAVIYVPAELGGNILPGMEAQIFPTNVNREEYGFMKGRVVSVSKYPVTAQSMMKTLENENLVSLMMGQAAPLMVLIDLIPDNKTKSGYSWSSKVGPPMKVDSGTIIQSSVVISREKPISKVMPILDKRH